MRHPFRSCLFGAMPLIAKLGKFLTLGDLLEPFLLRVSEFVPRPRSMGPGAPRRRNYPFDRRWFVVAVAVLLLHVAPAACVSTPGASRLKRAAGPKSAAGPKRATGGKKVAGLPGKGIHAAPRKEAVGHLSANECESWLKMQVQIQTQTMTESHPTLCPLQRRAELHLPVLHAPPPLHRAPLKWRALHATIDGR